MWRASTVCSGQITVKVTIRDGRIHGVEPLRQRENRPRTALEAIPERIVVADKEPRGSMP